MTMPCFIEFAKITYINGLTLLHFVSGNVDNYTRNLRNFFTMTNVEGCIFLFEVLMAMGR